MYAQTLVADSQADRAIHCLLSVFAIVEQIDGLETDYDMTRKRGVSANSLSIPLLRRNAGNNLMECVCACVVACADFGPAAGGNGYGSDLWDDGEDEEEKEEEEEEEEEEKKKKRSCRV